MTFLGVVLLHTDGSHAQNIKLHTGLLDEENSMDAFDEIHGMETPICFRQVYARSS